VRSLILDGEVCAFDHQLVSHMYLLSDPPEDEPVTPPVFMAFDLLAIRGRDLRRRPLADRRGELERALDGASFIFPARRLESHGLAAWDEVKRRSLEGTRGEARGWNLRRRQDAPVAQGEGPQERPLRRSGSHHGRVIVAASGESSREALGVRRDGGMGGGQGDGGGHSLASFGTSYSCL
jgi:hypothetical protein